MRPYLFFPFSHISENQLEVLLKFLPSFYVFPAASDLNSMEHLRNYTDKGRIIPILSEKDEILKVDQALKNYQAWADIHKGSQIHLKTLISENQYFTSDTDVLSIKSQITNKHTGEYEAQTPAHARQYKDLLFLKTAGQYDAEQENIELEFSRVNKAKDNMISGILGSDALLSENITKNKASTHDPGGLMTEKRLKAFISCINAAPAAKPVREQEEKLIWVTTSEAVLSYLEIICTNSINTLDINPVKVHEKDCENQDKWQKRLSDLIAMAAKGKVKDKPALSDENLLAADDACSLFGRISMTLFSGENIKNMFNLKSEYLPVCFIA